MKTSTSQTSRGKVIRAFPKELLGKPIVVLDIPSGGFMNFEDIIVCAAHFGDEPAVLVKYLNVEDREIYLGHYILRLAEDPVWPKLSLDNFNDFQQCLNEPLNVVACDVTTGKMQIFETVRDAALTLGLKEAPIFYQVENETQEPIEGDIFRYLSTLSQQHTESGNKQDEGLDLRTWMISTGGLLGGQLNQTLKQHDYLRQTCANSAAPQVRLQYVEVGNLLRQIEAHIKQFFTVPPDQMGKR